MHNSFDFVKYHLQVQNDYLLLLHKSLAERYLGENWNDRKSIENTPIPADLVEPITLLGTAMAQNSAALEEIAQYDEVEHNKIREARKKGYFLGPNYELPTA